AVPSQQGERKWSDRNGAQRGHYPPRVLRWLAKGHVRSYCRQADLRRRVLRWSTDEETTRFMRTAGHEPTVLRRRRTSMATILIDKNVMVPMRDGVGLATDVYRLDGATPAPVLLTRTPYDKEDAVVDSNTFDILRAVQAGYAVVIQDVRGRYAS